MGELPRSGNLETEIRWDLLLLRIWDTQLAANLACEEIGDLSMSWNRCNAAWIGEIDVLAMFCPFVGENTSEPKCRM